MKLWEPKISIKSADWEAIVCLILYDKSIHAVFIQLDMSSRFQTKKIVMVDSPMSGRSGTTANTINRAIVSIQTMVR